MSSILFLLDEGVPLRLLGALHSRHLDAVHVVTLGLTSATDDQILNEAVARDAAIVSFDSDFHQLLDTSGATKPSAIRIRDVHLPPARMADLLRQTIDVAGSALVSGAAVTIHHGVIRGRPLPLKT